MVFIAVTFSLYKFHFSTVLVYCQAVMISGVMNNLWSSERRSHKTQQGLYILFQSYVQEIFRGYYFWILDGQTFCPQSQSKYMHIYHLFSLVIFKTLSHYLNKIPPPGSLFLYHQTIIKISYKHNFLYNLQAWTLDEQHNSALFWQHYISAE